MRWQDHQEDDRLEDALKRFIEDITRERAEVFDFDAHRGPGDFLSPLVALCEVDGAYVVKAELPGVASDKLTVTVGAGSLVVEGEWPRDHLDKGGKWHLCESHRGSFKRVVELPGPVRGEGARAVLENGILRIDLPKAEAVKAALYNIKLS